MQEPSLNVYYSKKYLKRSFLKYLMGLSVWLGVFFVGVFPILINHNPNVGEVAHIYLATILIFIFAAWSIKFIKIMYKCARIFHDAPSIAYSLTNEGISNYQKGWFFSWQEIYDVATLIKNEGLCFRNGKKEIVTINSWGISPEEMSQIKNFILKSLSADKTKRLK